MSRPVATDLATILGAAGIGLTSGTNIFPGPVLEVDAAGTVPAKCVFILRTGGEPPRPFLGGGKTTYRSVSCQVKVRSDREDFSGGETLAGAALDALNLASAAPYSLIQVDESAPFYGGVDGSDRHWWSFVVTAEYVDAGT